MSIIEKLKSINNSGLVSYSLSQEDLQKRIDPLFPRKFDKFMCSFNLSAPKVLLSEDSDKIGVEIQVSADIPVVGQKSGVCLAQGELGYDPKTKQVFVQNPELLEIKIDGVSDKKLESLKDFSQSSFKEHLGRVVVYELPSNFAANSIKSISTKQGKLKISFGI